MIEKLEQEHIGAYVYYEPDYSDEKLLGRIKGFDNNSKKAWVAYFCEDNWNNYMDYTGANTDYKDLNFKDQ